MPAGTLAEVSGTLMTLSATTTSIGALRSVSVGPMRSPGFDPQAASPPTSAAINGDAARRSSIRVLIRHLLPGRSPAADARAAPQGSGTLSHALDCDPC